MNLHDISAISTRRQVVGRILAVRPPNGGWSNHGAPHIFEVPYIEVNWYGTTTPLVPSVIQGDGLSQIQAICGYRPRRAPQQLTVHPSTRPARTCARCNAVWTRDLDRIATYSVMTDPGEWLEAARQTYARYAR